MIGAVAAAAAIHVLSWLVQSCGQPMMLKLLADGGAATCGEFWLNRYQSLIAGMIALLGAWLTIVAMKRQTERMRSDDADRRMSKYTAALKNLMSALQGIGEPLNSTEFGASLDKLAEYERVANDPTLAEALADGALGRDVGILAFLISNMNRRASAIAHSRNTTREENMIGALHFAFLQSINRRQDLLRRGDTVSRLYDLALIDRKEVFASAKEGRFPILEV